VKVHYFLLLTATLSICGCGRQERVEAVNFAKLLSQKQADFNRANAVEKEFLAGTRGWCDNLTSSGAGRSGELAGHSATAAELAKSANSLSAQIGPLRQSVADVRLQIEELQKIRSAMMEKLQKRQRFLQEVRAALDESAAGFKALQQDRKYDGSSYPGGIGKLSQILQSYRGPDDVLAEAITAIRTKYDIKDAELGA